MCTVGDLSHGDCRLNSDPRSIVPFICKWLIEFMKPLVTFVILLCKSGVRVTLWLQASRMKIEQGQKLETISNTEAMHVTNKRQRVGSSNRLPTLVSLSWEMHMDEGNSSVSIYFKVYED